MGLQVFLGYPRIPARCVLRLNILNYHLFTSKWFNLCLRFLLTFAKNTHRIRAFRLVQRVTCMGLM